jgi:hypothetical protein
MSRALNSLLPVFMTLSFCTVANAGEYEKYLTAAEVKEATGFKEVVQKPENGREPLKFVNENGSIILTVRFSTAKTYNKAEAVKLQLVKEELKGIGEDAYVGPQGDLPYLLTFKKGSLAVNMTNFVNAKSTKTGEASLYLTLDQVKALAKIIAAKIQ